MPNTKVELISENKQLIAHIEQTRNNSNKSIIQPAKLRLDNNMTTPQQSTIVPPTQTELQMLINSIPEYSPGSNLSIFITEVESLLSHLNGRLTPDLLYILQCSLKSKIKGEARDFISYLSATTWEEIKKILLQKYGDQRSEDILLTNLTQTVQKRSESYMDFYARLVKNYNSLLQNIVLNATDANYLAYKKQECSNLVVKTFQIGVLEPYRSFLSHFELDSLEKCIVKCQLLDNRQTEWDYSEFLRKSQSHHQSSPNPPPRTSYTQNPQFTRSPIGIGHYTKPPQNAREFPQLRAITYPQTSARPPSLPPRQGRRPFNAKYIARPVSGMYQNARPAPTPMSFQSRVNTQQFNHSKPWTTQPQTQPVPMEINTTETVDTDYANYEEYYYYEDPNLIYGHDLINQDQNEMDPNLPILLPEPNVEQPVQVDNIVNFQEPASQLENT